MWSHPSAEKDSCRLPVASAPLPKVKLSGTKLPGKCLPLALVPANGQLSLRETAFMSLGVKKLSSSFPSSFPWLLSSRTKNEVATHVQLKLKWSERLLSGTHGSEWVVFPVRELMLPRNWWMCSATSRSCRSSSLLLQACLAMAFVVLFAWCFPSWALCDLWWLLWLVLLHWI